ncbi:MAG: DUF3566 domain-containing protein [Actinobacteria bacterium]|nr:DUF3566 domain-containing protein [Actinomycetota bacterium]
MVRRRLTLKRIDPWSVLKFGFVANLSLLAIGMLGFAVVWFFIERLRLIDQVCEIAIEMGFSACGINGGNLFRALFLLGLLGVVIQTGLMVFLAFLFNLIADLVGGLTFSFIDETPGAAARGDVPASSGRTTGTVTESPRPGDQAGTGQRKSPPLPLGMEGDVRRSPQPTSSSGSTGNPQRAPQSSAVPSPPRESRDGSGSPASANREAGSSSDRMWNDTQAVRRDPDDR